MKSIVQEGPTVFKAIETAWERSGKPQEFRIKVLETPQTQFFGLKTVKSAKIAFFFQEAPLKTPTERPQQQVRELRQTTREQRPAAPTTSVEKSPAPRPAADQRKGRRDPQQRPRPERQARPERNQDRNNNDQEREPRSFGPQASWDDAMVQTAKDWVQEAVIMMGNEQAVVTSQVSQNYLKLRVSASISQDRQQEEMMLKSWSSLAMEAVREKTNQPLRNLRIFVERDMRSK